MGRYTALAAALFGAIAILGAGCRQEPPVAPTPPAPTPAPPAPPPAPAPAPPAGSGSILTGTVVAFSEMGRVGPVPNLRLQVRQASSSDGDVGSTPLTDVTTDQNGRYEVRDVTAPILFVSTAPGSSHRFLCDGYPLMNVSATFGARDLPVVGTTWAGDRMPDGIWWAGTSVHGRVFERVNGDVVPVAGAVVTLETGTQDPPATTSATGFYMICSVVGTDQIRHATARRDGYQSTSRSFYGGNDFRIDFELVRR